jgi:hypothetical protein
VSLVKQQTFCGEGVKVWCQVGWHSAVSPERFSVQVVGREQQNVRPIGGQRRSVVQNVSNKTGNCDDKT